MHILHVSFGNKILYQIWQLGVCPTKCGLSSMLGRVAATGMNRITTHIHLILPSTTRNEQAPPQGNGWGGTSHNLACYRARRW